MKKLNDTQILKAIQENGTETEKLNKATCLLRLKGYAWQQEKRLWIKY